MKRLFTILLFSLSMATILLADEVKVDRSNCTITKDGKTFQMQGDVRIVNYGGSDVIDIRLVDYGGADVVEVKLVDYKPNSCDKIRVDDYGGSNVINVRIVNYGGSNVINVRIIS